jgi:2-phosphosulfolactate phosphatase
MIISRASLDTCQDATGAVVVIDVLRAFSTAAYAFVAGVQDITLVSTVAEALALRERLPGSLVMGEVDGLLVPGFDFANSPAQFDGLDLVGRHLIQRTSAGTQGVVRSWKADRLLAASFCNARATAQDILHFSLSTLTFVITGLRPGGWGDEDAACADYIEALLRGNTPAVAPLLDRVRQSLTGRLFADPSQPDFHPLDLEYCLAVDCFDFAMPIRREDGLFVMKSSRM